MDQLTNTQIFMIAQLEKAIKETKSAIKKANDKEKPKLRIKLKNLELQLENAKIPFERSEKEKEMIENMANKVRENVQIEKGAKIEGDASDKKLTSVEEFEYKLAVYINDNKNKITEIKKVLAVQEEVLETLVKHSPISEETLYAQNIVQIKDNITKLKVSIKSMQDRVDSGEEFIKEIKENYKFVSKLNRFLGNPLGLADYEEYAEKLKKEVEEGE